jgi:hypothetical protein
MAKPTDGQPEDNPTIPGHKEPHHPADHLTALGTFVTAFAFTEASMASALWAVALTNPLIFPDWGIGAIRFVSIDASTG